MLYHPSDREIQILPREIKRMLSVPAPNVRNTVPITTEKQAMDYLSQKIGRYGDSKKIAVEVDKYIAKAMNDLLATGFTYANLYAKDFEFLTEPHVAAALAYNELNCIDNIPDDIDLEYGLTYGKEMINMNEQEKKEAMEVAALMRDKLANMTAEEAEKYLSAIPVENEEE